MTIVYLSHAFSVAEDVSFSAFLDSHTTIHGNPTVFPTVKQNNGHGYDGSTGILSHF